MDRRQSEHRTSDDTLIAIWLSAIAVTLLTTGRYFDVAVRDVATAIAAFTLARLTDAGVGTESTDHVGALLGRHQKITA